LGSKRKLPIPLLKERRFFFYLRAQVHAAILPNGFEAQNAFRFAKNAFCSPKCVVAQSGLGSKRKFGIGTLHRIGFEA
jgi:hypothetical protein